MEDVAKAYVFRFMPWDVFDGFGLESFFCIPKVEISKVFPQLVAVFVISLAYGLSGSLTSCGTAAPPCCCLSAVKRVNRSNHDTVCTGYYCTGLEIM